MTEGSPDFERWIGARESLTDVVTAAQVRGLAATFDRDDAPPASGDPIPPGWHWLFFLAPARQSELGHDGHPERGRFLPPLALPRRMAAGGRMTFHRPLRVGEAIRREAELTAIRETAGRSGRLVFLTVRYAVRGEHGLATEEEQDIVYREAVPQGEPAPRPAPRPEAPGAADWHRTIEPDPVFLFRFSALTFNAHRIHYDQAYASAGEGYPGLIVHGPLTALLLLELCRDNVPERRLSRFEYRARRPLYVTAPFVLAGQMESDGTGCALWAADGEGAVAMTASAAFATS